jgi:O-antigen/teichoic acid export membrane protein
MTNQENEVGKSLSIIAKHSGITFAGKISGSGLKYITQIVLARILNPAFFGLYALGIVIYQVGETFSKIGLQAGATRFTSIYRSTGDRERIKGILIQSFMVPFFTGFLFMVLFVAASDFLAQKIFGEPLLGSAIRRFAVALPFGAAMTVVSVVTTAFQTTKYLVYIKNLFHPFLNLILIILFGLLGYGLHGTIAAWVISSILGAVLAFYITRQIFPQKAWKKVKSVFETFNLLKFSIPLAFGGFLWFLLLWMDTLMLGYFKAAADVGIYRAASQTALLLMIFLESINSIFSPMIAELFQENKIQKMEEIFKVSTRWSFSLTFPFFLIIALFGKEILHFFGSEFIIGWSPLLILSTGQLINSSTGSVGYILIMTGHQYLKLSSDIALFFLNILLNILLIPKWGLAGAAVATGVSVAGVNIIRAVMVYMTSRIQAYNWNYLKPVAAGILIIPLGLGLRKCLHSTHFMIALLLAGGVIIVVYTFLIWGMGLDENDKMIINKILKRFKSK